MDVHYDHRLIRSEDLFVAQITLNNLVFDENRSRLVRVVRGEQASIDLELPTQHFAEPSYDIAGMGHVPRVLPLFAGSRSRIDAIAPDGVDEFPIGADGIIGTVSAWTRNPGGSWIDVLATVWLRPPQNLRLTTDPLQDTDRHPLWSAQVTLPANGSIDLEVYGSSTWMPRGRFGQQEDGSGGPTLLPLGGPAANGARWRCWALTITALGGTASIAGPDRAILSQPPYGHTHRTSVGRTTYTRQVVTGHLSSGHAASLVVVAERRIAQYYSGDEPDVPTMSGYLDRVTTLIVTEPYVDLRAESGELSALVGLHAPTGERRVSGVDTSQPSWVQDTGGLIWFDLLAEDHAGTSIPMRMPLVFIPDGSDVQIAVSLVSAADAPTAAMPTAPVAVAPDPNAVFTLAAARAMPRTVASRPMIPVFQDFDVVVDQLGGVMDGAPVERFRFHDLYAQSALDATANPQGAVLQIVPPAAGGQLAVSLPPAAIGAIGNPGLMVGALTTQAGAVAQEMVRSAVPSLDDIRAAFPSARLFGSIDLLALLEDAPFGTDGRPSIPAVQHRHVAEGEEFTYTFHAALKPQKGAVVVGADSRLELTSTVLRRTDGRTTAESHGIVTNIGISLFEVVELSFAAVEFRASSGTTTFDVRGPELEFGKELEFVAVLARKLKETGLGSGVRVDVDPQGVTAGFGLALPDVALAALQFSNLTIDAWLRVPFTGSPMAFTLAVASRERPFLVTVSMFGGGGWFALEVSPRGIRRLELGIEFGGSLSLDIIVASGGVTVMAGIYVEWNATEGRTAFRAYLRASGHLSVLGIITVFVEFVLELAYEKRALTAGGPRYAVFSGRATVTVGVEVLFFSKSVNLTVERSFVGSPADPSFTDCFGLAEWDAYCDAFVAEIGGGDARDG